MIHQRDKSFHVWLLLEHNFPKLKNNFYNETCKLFIIIIQESQMPTVENPGKGCSSYFCQNLRGGGRSIAKRVPYFWFHCILFNNLFENLPERALFHTPHPPVCIYCHNTVVFVTISVELPRVTLTTKCWDPKVVQSGTIANMITLSAIIMKIRLRHIIT